ncbi:hypothetical protein ACWD4J_11385 [Streptomyces sp. NPDC002577]
MVRAWNDYLVEHFLPHRDRLRPTAAIPLTAVPGAVAQIERCARAVLGGTPADVAGFDTSRKPARTITF